MYDVKGLEFLPAETPLCADDTRRLDRRMECGELMLGWHKDWPKLFENILWSDEAVLHISGFVNRHNCHY